MSARVRIETDERGLPIHVVDFEAGEKGELGENLRGPSNSHGRTKGESGRTEGEFDAEKAKKLARECLLSVKFTPPEYPIDALGDILAPAAKSIADNGQLAPAMAGQSLLGAAALVTQSHYNVATLAGTKPLSEYFLTIGESGDGKTTADAAALQPVRTWQRDKAIAYRHELTKHEEATATRSKGEPPPTPPLAPWALMKDATIEGIRSGFQHGRPCQGIFTAEAAAMLAGYGMSKDNRQKTCATFNDLWDDGELSVSRALAGRIQLYGKRLSAHWLIQPEAAREALGDPILSAMGFWPRFLIAWPKSAPARKAKPFEPVKCKDIETAWKQFAELLKDPVPDDCSGLPVIGFTRKAQRLVLHPAFERFEREAKTEGGKFCNIRPFALRATEHVCRVAGILAAIDGKKVITADATKRALNLVLYSIETWRTLAGDREESEAAAWALCLFDWIADHGGAASETAMLRRGPKKYALRSASRRDAALAVLELAGLVQRQGATWEIVQ